MTPAGEAQLRPILTASWDDGHPEDGRLAELLHRRGFAATFYVPCSNREGLPVISPGKLREIDAAGFEIGGHTLEHCYLTTIEDREAERQISTGKAALEDALGKEVRGFAYPGGRFRRHHRRLVQAAGYRYARSSRNLFGQIPRDLYSMPVTLQFYPHPPAVLLRNFLSQGAWPRRTPMLLAVSGAGNLLQRLCAGLEAVCRSGGVFHLWGHSHELSQFDGWRLLDEFLAFAADRIPQEDRVSNYGALRQRSVLQ